MEQWQFLEEQEFLRKASSLNIESEERIEQAIWERGPACQDVANLGRTLEWYITEWFRREWKAAAYHGVEIQELPLPGDLDVVAFKDGACILVECKSSSQIEEQKLRLLLQRSSAFYPNMILLLINTPSAASIEVRTRQLCQLLHCPYEAAYRQCWGKTFFQGIGAQNLYVANTGAGISATLAAVMRFHEALMQVRLYR